MNGIHISLCVELYIILHLELNPGELLNACLKQRVTTAVLARTKMQLVKSTSRALRSIQKQHARGKRCFQHPAVKNAA